MKTIQAEYREQNYVVPTAVSCDQTVGEKQSGIFNNINKLINYQILFNQKYNHNTLYIRLMNNYILRPYQILIVYSIDSLQPLGHQNI